MVYFAKIKKIDFRRNKCIVVFDDKSNDEAHFSQIHSGESLLLAHPSDLAVFRSSCTYANRGVCVCHHACVCGILFQWE